MKGKGHGRDLNFQSTSEYAGRGLFKWRIFLNEKKEVLNRIHQIRYILHPSFYNPIRDITKKYKKFELKSQAWGEFSIHIIVLFKNKKTYETDYYLELNWDQVPEEDYEHFRIRRNESVHRRE